MHSSVQMCILCPVDLIFAYATSFCYISKTVFGMAIYFALAKIVAKVVLVYLKSRGRFRAFFLCKQGSKPYVGTSRIIENATTNIISTELTVILGK